MLSIILEIIVKGIDINILENILLRGIQEIKKLKAMTGLVFFFTCSIFVKILSTPRLFKCI